MKSKCVIVYGKLFQHRGGAHVKNDRTKILNDYFSANEIFDENHLIFFPISGSLLAYLRCIYITSCFPSKILMLSKQCAVFLDLF